MRLFRLATLIVFAVSVGCGDRAPSTPVDHNGRLQAAFAIQNLGAKDESLASVAKGAASAGEGEVTKQALAGIQNIGKRDDTAEACALNLAKAGKSGAAAEVAQSIQNIGKRDAVLARIAKEGG